MTAKILVIDIERQSALVDGVWELPQRHGSYIHPDRVIEPPRTICFAYRWYGEDKTRFVAEWDGRQPQDNESHTPGGGHQVMIEKAWALFNEADYIVGYNSKNFDVKHLKTGFWLYNLGPTSPHVDIDLMQQASRAFGQGLLAKSMAFVAKVKGYEGKLQNEKGLWRTLRFAKGDILRRAHRSMKKYNLRDVDQTIELFEDLRPWLTGLNLGLHEPDAEDILCTNCGSDDLQYRGEAGNHTFRYRRIWCKSCGKWGRDRASIRSIQNVGIA